MVFMPSVAISALVVEDELRVIQGVAELMICRLCMFLMQVQSRASWGPKGVGFFARWIRGDQPDLRNQSCLTFHPLNHRHYLLHDSFVFFPYGSIQSGPDVVINVIYASHIRNTFYEQKRNLHHHSWRPLEWSR